MTARQIERKADRRDQGREGTEKRVKARSKFNDSLPITERRLNEVSKELSNRIDNTHERSKAEIGQLEAEIDQLKSEVEDLKGMLKEITEKLQE